MHSADVCAKGILYFPESRFSNQTSEFNRRILLMGEALLLSCAQSLLHDVPMSVFRHFTAGGIGRRVEFWFYTTNIIITSGIIQLERYGGVVSARRCL